MRSHILSFALLCAPIATFAQLDFDARILDYKGLKFPCDGTVTPKLLIRNDGNVTMSGCVVETWKNGVVVNSFNWQLAVPAASGESRQPVLPDVSGVDAGDQLEFKIKTVNTIPDENADGNDRTVSMEDPYSGTFSNTIEVTVITDDAPADLTWEIRDAGGALLASGGPYEEPNTTIDEEVVLAANACYAFKGSDSGRDESSSASMKVKSGGNVLFTYGALDLAASPTKGITTGDGPSCTNDLEVALRTDHQPLETSWSIIAVADGATVCTGAGTLTANANVMETCCLADGCYRLAVSDMSGDGIVGGGYVLRMSNGQRIIDNEGNFISGSYSAISGGQGFCLPIGTGRPIFTSCDKLDWLANRYLVASADASVSAQYGITNSTSGYEFWFFDPNGTYSFRRFRNHATGDGTGSGATRACHFRLNGWTNGVLTPHLPEGVLLNVRIRNRVAGENQEFGPTCRFKMDAALAACPQVKLQNDPSNTSDYSCGVTRSFGGANRAANRLVAAPPQFVPAVASSSVRYQFRFRSGVQCVVRPPQTSPAIYLNWSGSSALLCGVTYQVDVRVSKDSGVTWCTGALTTDAPANCADAAPWGVVCAVTIGGCQQQSVAPAHTLNTERTLSIFPNPVNDGHVTLVFDASRGTMPVDLELMDPAGRRVWSQHIPLAEGVVNVQVELDASLAPGVHFLVAHRGGHTYVERLVIAR